MSEFVKENLIVLLDSVQRTVIAEELPDRTNAERVVIKNPVVVNIIPQMETKKDARGQLVEVPTGQMALQLIPIFFREFMGDKSEGVVFNYPKNLMTFIDKFAGGFDFRLYEQYKQIFYPSRIVTPTDVGQIKAPDAPTLKLFGD